MQPRYHRQPQPGDDGYGWGGGESHYYTNLFYEYTPSLSLIKIRDSSIQKPHITKEALSELKNELEKYRHLIEYQYMWPEDLSDAMIQAMRFMSYVRDGPGTYSNSEFLLREAGGDVSKQKALLQLQSSNPLKFFFELSPKAQDWMCLYHNKIYVDLVNGKYEIDPIRGPVKPIEYTYTEIMNFDRWL